MKTHYNKKLTVLTLLFFIVLQGIGRNTNEPCLTVSRVKIVVIGEDVNHDKTITGDPIWIDEYRKYLKSFNTDNEIINMMKKGISSYNIVPTGSSTPYSRPGADPKFNITKALELNPDAIIVNLEYNDLINNFQNNEQIINIMLVASEANRHNIPIWINTPKPRKFDAVETQKSHEDYKNLIKERFSPFVVDFWEMLSDENQQLLADYSTDDKIHINSKGQGKMLKTLVSANIHQYCARRLYNGGKDISLYSLKEDETEGSNKKFTVTIANAGSKIENPIKIALKLKNKSTNQEIIVDNLIENGLDNCQFKSISFDIKDVKFGNYHVSAYIANRIDRNQLNDTTTIDLGHAMLNKGDNKGKQSSTKANKDISLYAINIDGFSSNFNRQNTAENYAFSNSGGAKLYTMNDIFNEKDINASTFKIQADRAMEISALEVEVENPGNKLIEVFYKRNLNEDRDNDLQYWTLASSQEVVVDATDTPLEIPTKDILLKRNSNVGIYIRTTEIARISSSKDK